MNTIIFLGGIPGTGKTTLAYKLASMYRIDKVISLDVIKNTMKSLIKSDDNYLFSTTHQAYKIENLNIVDGYIKHTFSINEYFYKIINSFVNEKVIIVEGATITNEFVNRFKKSNIIYINLYIDEEEKLIERYNLKSRMRCGKWIENINAIEEINEYLKSQSLINLKSDDEVINKVREYIDESIFL